MTTGAKNLIRVGSAEEVKRRGCTVVTGGGHTIAVFKRDDGFAAVDNRCPHMGFPLDRGPSRTAFSPVTGTTPASTFRAAAHSIRSRTT